MSPRSTPTTPPATPPSAPKPLAAPPSQGLVWTAEGKLGNLTEGTSATDYVYDADGQLLIRRDPAGETVLYTPSTEVHLKGAKKWGTRSYSISGVKAAVLTNESGTAKLSFVVGDAHGTSSLAVSADDTQAVSKRYTTPFGSARGPAAANWPDDKRFLDKSEDTARGLTHVGAREYDTALGQFLSVDPVLSLDQHQSLNGYSYANNSPVTFSDPTGLESCGSSRLLRRRRLDQRQAHRGHAGGRGPGALRGELRLRPGRRRDARRHGEGGQTFTAWMDPGEDRGIIMVRYYIHTYDAMSMVPGFPMLLGDNRGSTDDPHASYRMVLWWDTATGEIVFNVAPSHTMPGKRTVSSYATGGAPMEVDVASQMVPALPILFDHSALRTLTGKNVLRNDGSTPKSLKLSVHGVQPVMWVGSVDNWLEVTPTKDSVTVSRTGNAYPDMEVVQYQKGQKPRWGAFDAMAHTSGYDAAPLFGGMVYNDRDHRTWVNGTCKRDC